MARSARWIAARQLGLPLSVFADALAPALPLAQAIGRFGNWFNNELYGRSPRCRGVCRCTTWTRPTPGHATVIDGEPVTTARPLPPDLPLRGDLGRRRRRAGLAARPAFKFGRGRAFALYVMAYTAGRFWIEMLRIDEANHFFGIRLNVFTSIVVFLGALAYFLLVTGPRDYVVPDRRAGDRAATGRPAAEGDVSPGRRAAPVAAAAAGAPQRVPGGQRGAVRGVPSDRRAAADTDADRRRRRPRRAATAGPRSTRPARPARRGGAGHRRGCRSRAGGGHRRRRRADRPADVRPTTDGGDVRTAVVVGAGMAGLATAGALARSGWQVTLLERGERVAAPPTALVLWSNGRRALESLDPDGGWSAIASPLPDGGVRRPDGQWLVRAARPVRRRPGAGGGAPRGPVRRAGRRPRRPGRDPHRLRRSPRCAPAGGQRPAVGDGRTLIEADLLVAADGIDSPVRRALAPESAAVGSGFAAWQAVIPGYRVPRLPPEQAAGGETLGAGYRFVSIPLGERAAGKGGVYWVATAAGAPRPESPATQLALLRRWFAGWHAAGGRAARRHPARRTWCRRRCASCGRCPGRTASASGPGGVVLLGDAAHAMPHHLGQGACLAFEDAATLRSLVADAAARRRRCARRSSPTAGSAARARPAWSARPAACRRWCRPAAGWRCAPATRPSTTCAPASCGHAQRPTGPHRLAAPPADQPAAPTVAARPRLEPSAGEPSAAFRRSGRPPAASRRRVSRRRWRPVRRMQAVPMRRKPTLV